MEPTDYHAHMALGLVCFKEFKGARDELAKKHFGVALRLRPDLYQLHFYLGELMSREVGSEDREAAQAHFRRFIAEAPPEDPMLDSAREALRGLQRSLVAPEVGRPAGVSKKLGDHIRRGVRRRRNQVNPLSGSH